MHAEDPTACVPGAGGNPRRRRAALAQALALALSQLPACALEAVGRGQLVEMSIIDRDSGQVLTPYRKDGRTYVAGNPASRYAIRLANRTGGRVLVVLSVDGINVVSGQSAAFGQTGYVLDPWRTYDIAGWRKSDSAIAAFVFAALPDSYAARTGRPDNVGVIGMAAFQEKPQPPSIGSAKAPPVAAQQAGSADESARGTAAAKPESAPGNAARPSASAADSAGRLAGPEGAAQSEARMARRERLGTGHGEREWSVSRRTNFERLSHTPQEVVEIGYDSYSNLVAAGVIPSPVAAGPRAFPGSDAGVFVPDPPTR